jgi:hypothetical protein
VDRQVLSSCLFPWHPLLPQIACAGWGGPGMVHTKLRGNQDGLCLMRLRKFPQHWGQDGKQGEHVLVHVHPSTRPIQRQSIHRQGRGLRDWRDERDQLGTVDCGKKFYLGYAPQTDDPNRDHSSWAAIPSVRSGEIKQAGQQWHLTTRNCLAHSDNSLVWL